MHFKLYIGSMDAEGRIGLVAFSQDGKILSVKSNNPQCAIQTYKPYSR